LSVGNRLDNCLPLRHDISVDALRRACEDVLYGFDPSVDVPLAAAEVLGEGLMSSALVELACLRRDDLPEIRVLIPAVFTEFGYPLPSAPAAAFARAQETAHACLAGALTTRVGLHRLIKFLMRNESCGDTYCHGHGDILRFQETDHADNCPRCQAAGTVPNWFPNGDMQVQFHEFLQELAASDHECA
jgi:hypothetical protein